MDLVLIQHIFCFSQLRYLVNHRLSYRTLRQLGRKTAKQAGCWVLYYVKVGNKVQTRSSLLVKMGQRYTGVEQHLHFLDETC